MILNNKWHFLQKKKIILFWRGNFQLDQNSSNLEQIYTIFFFYFFFIVMLFGGKGKLFYCSKYAIKKAGILFL